MARSVFFSFHYQRDIWRVNQVRNSGFTQPETGFIDHSLWEETKRRGDAALRSLIDGGLHGAGVTAVLIGAETAHRRWVKYEIERSVEDRKGLLGIRIHRLHDRDQRSDIPGRNPFDDHLVRNDAGRTVALSTVVPVYDWVIDDGYLNMSTWVDLAAGAAGR